MREGMRKWIGLGLIACLTGLLAAAGCKGETAPAPVNGERPLLVILWYPKRPEVPEVPTRDQVEDLVFGQHPSVAHYFNAQSRGKVRLINAGVLSYLADKPASHYWNHPAPGTPGGDEFKSGHVEKWAEAIRKAARDFDFTAYDKNRDGKLTPSELGILIVIPQLTPFGTNRGALGAEYPKETPLVVDGVTINSIAEVYTGVAKQAKNIPMNWGVVGHELGHLFFGTVDLYFQGSLRPGHFSLMDVTYTDTQYDPFHKMRAGWLEPRIVTQSGSYELTAGSQNGDALKILRPKHSPPEYFIIENRQHGEYDSKLPDTGLAIWRFIDDESSSNWVEKSVHLIRNPRATASDVNALWHAPDATTAQLNWADGTPSGISLRDIPVSGPNMKLTIEFP